MCDERHHLAERYLKSENNSIQVQGRCPVLTKNVETNVSVEVDVGVVDFLGALDLRRFEGVLALIGCKGELEDSSLVDSLVGSDV
jgi:hypothetical protein